MPYWFMDLHRKGEKWKEEITLKMDAVLEMEMGCLEKMDRNLKRLYSEGSLKADKNTRQQRYIIEISLSRILLFI